LPTRRCAAQLAGALERLEHLTQALILDRKAIAELRPREHDACGQDVEHLLLETASLAVLVLRDDLQVDRLRFAAMSARGIGADAGAARCSVESTKWSLPRRK
jgi:hypothetical protein